jgi:hypothetical protein
MSVRMHTAVTSFFVTLTLITTGVAQGQEPISAYEVIKDAACISAIHQVHSDIENRLKGKVQQVTYNSAVEGNPAVLPPIATRKMQVTFDLNTKWSRGGGGANEEAHNANIALTASPQLARQYADLIVSSCDDVGSVVIYMYEWGVGWSVGNNMKLIQDRCFYPLGARVQTRTSLSWGEMPCY